MSGSTSGSHTLHELIEEHLAGHTFTVGADLDEEVLEHIRVVSKDLPARFDELIAYLASLQDFASYEPALVFAAAMIRARMASILRDVPLSIFEPSGVELPKDIYARVARHFAKDITHRARAKRLVDRVGIDDVALPSNEDGRWDHSGWRKGLDTNGIYRHATGKRRQNEVGVPELMDLQQLRELLGIKSEKQLGFMLLATDRADSSPYHTFTIPKKTGGYRRIAAPNPQLRAVQQKILVKILAPLPVHDAAHGYVTGRSTVTNAAPHIGKAVLIKFDLANFFDTIDYWRVVGLFASFGYALGDLAFRASDLDTEVAPTLARLCCYTQRSNQSRIAYTPQGAPTSPAISNLICRTLDKRLDSLAKKLGGDYTRYADDLTFSFHNLPGKGVGRFRWWVNQICHQEGFFVREDKFRVIRSSQQQRVTGIVVNEQLSIPRRDRRRFRAIVHNCEKHGVASQARGRERFEDYLMGYASYMKMVHPEEGAELLAKVKSLLSQGGGDE